MERDKSLIRRKKNTIYESKSPACLIYVASFSVLNSNRPSKIAFFSVRTFAAPDLQHFVQRIQALSFLEISPKLIQIHRNKFIQTLYSSVLSNPRRNLASVHKSCGFWAGPMAQSDPCSKEGKCTFWRKFAKSKPWNAIKFSCYFSQRLLCKRDLWLSIEC